MGATLCLKVRFTPELSEIHPKTRQMCLACLGIAHNCVVVPQTVNLEACSLPHLPAQWLLSCGSHVRGSRIKALVAILVPHVQSCGDPGSSSSSFPLRRCSRLARMCLTPLRLYCPSPDLFGLGFHCVFAYWARLAPATGICIERQGVAWRLLEWLLCVCEAGVVVGSMARGAVIEATSAVEAAACGRHPACFHIGRR